MIPKKILISSLSVIGAGVGVTAVATPLAITANTQSVSADSVDIDQPNNENGTNDNSDSQVEDQSKSENQTESNSNSQTDDSLNNQNDNNQSSSSDNYVAIPSSTDVFVSDTTIYYSNASDNASLNTYLTNYFKIREIADCLSNSYENVTLLYVDDSANYNDATFQVVVALNSGYSWVGGSKENKTITVMINNIDKTIWTATAPSSDIYTIAISNVSDDTTLNAYFVDVFENNAIASSLVNANSYANVTLSYVQNSASFSASSFKMNATPNSGYAWSDSGNSNSKTITVTIQQLDNLATTASIPNTNSFNASISASTDSNLNTALYKLFNYGYDKSKVLDYFVNSSQYKNVDISYVNNSANLDTKTFTIAVTPKTGYLWNDDKTSKTKTVSVNLTNLTAKGLATVPEVWSVNTALTASNYSYGGDTKNGSVGYSNLSMFYTNVDYLGLDSSRKSGYVTLSTVSGRSSKVYFTPILVQPKDGYLWSDGTKFTKSVVIYTFSSFMQIGSYYSSVNTATVGSYNTANLDEVASFANSVSNDTFNYWISNFIYVPSSSDANEPTNATYLEQVKSLVLTDIQNAIGDQYYVRFANTYDGNGNLKNFIWYNYGSNGDNNITLGYYYLQVAPKTSSGYDASKMKNMTGYLFTTSQSKFSFIQSYIG